MDLFTVVQDGKAILRLPKGVLKQVDLYQRGTRFYVPFGGGYVEIRHMVQTSMATVRGCHATSHPDVQVLDFENGVAKVTYVKDMGQEMVRIAGGAVK